MLQIRLLGPLEVLRDGAAVPLSGGRAGSLLAILALQPGRALSVETLVERCWDEETPADPRARLHTAVRRLRHLVGNSSIRTTRLGYALEVEPENVDAVTFAGLLNRVSEAGPAEVGAALALWRGEPFAGDFCGWLTETERTRLIQLWLSAVERRADLEVAAGRADAVVGELQELVARYPLRESLWSRLLLALSACGRAAESLEQYGVIRDRVREELGVEPGAELRHIFEQLLAGEMAVSVVPAPTPPVPQQLPTDIVDFHGRVPALTELDRVLAHSGGADAPTGVVVLHGPGGVGKTSLAVHWAHQQAAAFLGGRFFLNLHGYGPGEPVDPTTALETVLHALGVSADAVPSDVDGRSALMRSIVAGRRILLVLDDVRSEDQVRPLLPGSGATVLITSRNRLRGLAARDHAVQITVDPMSIQESTKLLRSRIPYDIDDAALLREVARRCSHLPLALVIAAEQVASRTESGLEELAEDLDEIGSRLDALGSGDDMATNLRAVFGWSYRTLDERSARFFRLLGVIPVPTFSAEAAAAVAECSIRTARSTLRRLADLHLVNEISSGRFGLHDLLRAYAGERAEQEETEGGRWDAQERLLDWYNHTLWSFQVSTNVGNALSDPGCPLPTTTPLTFADKAEARAWLAGERSVLTELVTSAARLGHHAQTCRLAVQMWDDLFARAAAGEAMLVQKLAIRSAQAANMPVVEAVATNQLAITYGMFGRLDDAKEQFNIARAAFAESGHRHGQALVHVNLGLLHGLRDEPDEEMHNLHSALHLARQGDVGDVLFTALNMLAIAHMQRGEHATALSEAEESLAGFSNEDDDHRTAQAEDTLGQIHMRMGNPDTAAEFFDRAAQRNLRSDAPAPAVANMTRQGEALRAAGRPTEARAAWTRALELTEIRLAPEIGDGEPLNLELRSMPTCEELRSLIDGLDGPPGNLQAGGE